MTAPWSLKLQLNSAAIFIRRRNYLSNLHLPGRTRNSTGHLPAKFDDTSRRISRASIRARRPDRVTEFYTKIFELKGVEEFSRDKEISLTDGKVRLLIRPCNENLYRGMRQGLDPIGF